jgi:hypothetical protein
MTSGRGLAALGATIHPYPTRSELLRRLADEHSQARVTPTLQRWLARWIRLLR